MRLVRAGVLAVLAAAAAIACVLPGLADATEFVGAPPDPRLEVVPDLHDFGGQPANGHAGTPVDFEVMSTGETPAVIDGAAIAGLEPGEFEITSDDCSGAELPSGDSCHVAVAFTPHGEGSKIAQLEITSNASEGVEVAELVGTGNALPEGVVSPDAFNFLEQIVGVGGDTQTFTVVGLGPGPLHLGAIIAGGESSQFDLVAESCEHVDLAPGERCTFVIEFVPTTPGFHLATFEVQGDAELPIVAEMFGTGTLDPGIELEPTELDFGARPANTGPSAEQAAEVVSTGRTPLHVSGATLVGANADQFEIVEDECDGATLPFGGGRCGVDVVFNPTEDGPSTASLQVESDAGTELLPLVGVGQADSGIAVEPSSLDFGELNVGSGPGTARAITVESTGTTPLEVGELELRGTDASQFRVVEDECIGVELEPGKDCEVEVAFAPTTSGSKVATLVFGSDDSSGLEPPAVALNGTGTEVPAPPAEEKKAEGKKTPPAAVTPPPPPPACVPVEVKNLAPYTVRIKRQPRSPGLRARFTLGSPGLIEVAASVTYRLGGIIHTATLGKSRLHAGAFANYKVAIPSSLRGVLVPGTHATLKLRYRAKSDTSGCGSFGRAAEKALRTQVVLISR